MPSFSRSSHRAELSNAYNRRWLHQLAPFMGYEANQVHDGVPIYTQAYELNELFTCPVLHAQSGPDGQEYEARYGYNLALAPEGQMLGIRSVGIQRPAKTVVVATKADGAPGVRPALFPNHPFGVAASMRKDRNPTATTANLPETGETGYLFGDGHVEVLTEWIGPERFSPSQ